MVIFSLLLLSALCHGTAIDVTNASETMNGAPIDMVNVTEEGATIYVVTETDSGAAIDMVNMTDDEDVCPYDQCLSQGACLPIFDSNYTMVRKECDGSCMDLPTPCHGECDIGQCIVGELCQPCHHRKGLPFTSIQYKPSTQALSVNGNVNGSGDNFLTFLLVP